MKCPVCKDVTLLMMDKSWIEIDYCPECRWVWLDRWELEKLIDKTTSNIESNYTPKPKETYEKNYNNWDYNNKKHKKESIFWEIFDIF